MEHHDFLEDQRLEKHGKDDEEETAEYKEHENPVKSIFSTLVDVFFLAVAFIVLFIFYLIFLD